MTDKEKYDRWERFARLFYERSIRESRESRRQTVQLRAYVGAQREYEVLKLALEAKPDDSAVIEASRKSRETLDRAREELRHLIRKTQIAPSVM